MNKESNLLKDEKETENGCETGGALSQISKYIVFLLSNTWTLWDRSLGTPMFNHIDNGL